MVEANQISSNLFDSIVEFLLCQIVEFDWVHKNFDFKPSVITFLNHFSPSDPTSA